MAACVFAHNSADAGLFDLALQRLWQNGGAEADASRSCPAAEYFSLGVALGAMRVLTTCRSCSLRRSPLDAEYFGDLPKPQSVKSFRHRHTHATCDAKSDEAVPDERQ